MQKELGNIVLNGYELCPPREGEINIYYGRIGQGKTSIGSLNIQESLMQGNVVFASWPIDWNGYDERNLWKYKILGVLGLKRYFIQYPKENFHHFNFVEGLIDGKEYEIFFGENLYETKEEKPEQRHYKFVPIQDNFQHPEWRKVKMSFADALARITDADLHLDEGHIPFDSYEATRMPERKRSAIFAQRHFNRSLTIYTQRANSVHINLRGNTNRFFKCEKLTTLHLWFTNIVFIHFLITEFQDLTSSSTVDETRILDEEGLETDEYKFAVTDWTYWATNIFRSSHLNTFDSKYLRKGLKESQENFSKEYFLGWKDRFINFLPRRWHQDNSEKNLVQVPTNEKRELDKHFFSELKSPR